MSFAQDSIGFYLQLSDELSPALKKASDNYWKFVAELEKANKAGFEIVSKGTAALGKLIESFDQLPKLAVRSYQSAITALQKKMRPLTQRINVTFSAASEKSISRAIGHAVSDAMSHVRLRLSAKVPTRRQPGFDTGKSLRAIYQDTTQPPDMLGRFHNLPRFAAGGEVTGGGGKGIDDVLALLSKGEIVLPADIAERLKEMAAAAMDSSTNVGGSAEQISKLTNLVAVLALQMAKFVKVEEKAVKTEDKHTKSQKRVENAMKQTRNEMGRFTKATDAAGKEVEQLLDDAMAPARFSALNDALGSLTMAFSQFSVGAQNAFDLAGGGRAPVESFMDSLNDANLVLGKSRHELSILKGELSDMAKGFKNVGADQFAAAFRDLVKSGAGEAFSKQNAGLVAQLTQTGMEASAAAEMTYKLRDSFKFAQSDVLGLVENLRVMAKEGAIPFEKLASAQQENLESLGAFLLELDSVEARQKLMTNLGAATTALTKNWGDAGGQLTKLMTQALAGGQEAIAQLTGLGVDMTALQESAKRGDVTTAMQGMVKTIQGLGADSPMLATLAETLRFPGTTEEFAKIVKEGDKVLASFDQLSKATMNNAKAQDTFNQRLEGSESRFKAFTKDVGKFILGMVPTEVLDFLDGFNLQAALAIGYLGKLGLGFAGSALKMVGFGKAAKAAKAATAVSEAATGAGVVAAGGRGGIGGFLRGLADGIKAFGNAAVVKGIVVLEGALAGLAAIVVGSVKIGGDDLNKFISIFTDLSKYGMDSIVKIVDTLSKVDASRAVGSVAALGLIGPALLTFFTSMMAFKALSVASFLPGKALDALFNLTSGGRGLTDQIIDVAVMVVSISKAISSLGPTIASSIERAAPVFASIVGFMVNYATLTAAVAGAKVATLTAAASEKIIQLFSEGHSSLDWISANVDEIKRVTEAVSKGFARVSFTEEDLTAAAINIKAIATFLSGYATLNDIVKDIKPGVFDVIGENFIKNISGGKSALERLANTAEVVSLDTVPIIVGAFGKVNITEEAMAAANAGIARVAQVLGMFRPMIDLVQETGGKAAGLSSEGLGKVADFFTGTQRPLDAIKNNLIGDNGILRTVDAIGVKIEEVMGNDPGKRWRVFANDSTFNTIVNGLDRVLSLTTRIASVSATVQQLVNFSGDPLKAAERFRSVTDAVGIMASSLSTLIAPEIGRGEDFWASIAKQAERVMTVVQAFKGAYELGQVSAGALETILKQPILTTNEVQKVVRVELDPNTTDRPVLDESKLTNDLLLVLIDAVRNGQNDKKVSEKTNSGPFSPSPWLENMAKNG